MRINHNIQALNAYRNLSQTMNATSKSLEKLSSGLRINKAADDAAGLAISEKMRSQIRGLDMAERNTLDAISLIQTGEGALNEVHSILQRMRELSVQAANGTLEDTDREAIQTEINQLTLEVDRIADTTQFNQKKLFSGSEKGIAFAEINTDQVKYSGKGSWQGIVTAEPTENAQIKLDFPIETGSLKKDSINGETFKINGLVYEVYSDDTSESPKNGNIVVDLTEEWTDGEADSDAIANINHLMEKLTEAVKQNDNILDATYTNAIENEVDKDDDDTILSGSLILETKNPMSPVDAKSIKVEKVPTSVTILDPNTSEETDSFVASETADYTNSINIGFSEVPKDGDQLKIDNLTITFKDGSSQEYSYQDGEGTINIDIKGKDVFTILSEVNSSIDQIKENDSYNVLTALTSHDVVGSTLVLSTNRTKFDESFDDDGSNGLEVAIVDGDFEANKGKDLSLEFQIGANSSESLKINLSVMDAASLGIGRNEDGTETLVGVNAEKGINVMTTEAANASIDIIDNAIKIVSAVRSNLGAIQNRLEYTTTNLQTAGENLTSAESRIRDLDMAEEMTNFTKNNILNQAGQAMLAQANQLPQGILQLLQ